MEWFYLVVAGVFEIGWAIGLKYSHGFTKTLPSILTIIGMVASFYFLSLSLKSLPIGTAYAIWTGIGTIGTVLLGIILFKEPINTMRIVCIVFIVSGIIGLKLISVE
jgi:quaternary ammonium compound-resistance protein SugE